MQGVPQQPTPSTHSGFYCSKHGENRKDRCLRLCDSLRFREYFARKCLVFLGGRCSFPVSVCAPSWRIMGIEMLFLTSRLVLLLPPSSFSQQTEITFCNFCLCLLSLQLALDKPNPQRSLTSLLSKQVSPIGDYMTRVGLAALMEPKGNIILTNHMTTHGEFRETVQAISWF